MSDDDVQYLTTRELAQLLRIKERRVYELAASGEVPCSRATGKLLFPRRAVQAWIAEHSSGPRPASSPAPANVFLGSHDPLLEWALRESRCALATFLDGSLDGLNRFQAFEGVAAGLHLCSPALDEWNVHEVRERLGSLPVVLVEFAWRERGLIVARENPRKICRMVDLEGCRVVPRQREAGSQVLMDTLMADSDLDAARVEFIAPARTEADAAVAVLEGDADAAFGLKSLALQHRLEFIPVIKERFDLLVNRRAWFEPPLQRLFAFLASDAFERKAKDMRGYDVSGLMRVHFNGG